MTIHPTTYTLPFLITTGISGIIAAYNLYRRDHTGAKPFAVVMLSVMVWSLSHTFQVVVDDAVAQLFLAQVVLTGMIIAPLAWIAYVLEFTGNQWWLTRRNLLLSSIVPALTLLAAGVNGPSVYGLAKVETRFSDSLTFLTLREGWILWLQAGYQMLLLSSALALLFWKYNQPASLGRRHTGLVLAASILPWAASLLHSLGLTPIPYPDWRPFALVLSGGLITWGKLHYRMLNIVPIARNKVFDSMSEGVFVLDEQDRVVDANQAAITTISLPACEILNQSIEQVYSKWSALVSAGEAKSVKGLLGLEETHQVIRVTRQDGEAYYEVRITPLNGTTDQPGGRLVVWRDVTQHKQVELALRASEESHRQSVENSPNPIFSVDQAGRIRSWNRACEDIFQYGQDIIGQSYRSIVPDDGTISTLDAMLKHVFEDNESFSDIDIGYRCKNGSERFMVSRLYPLADRKEGVHYCIFANTDITERKLNETSLRRQFDELSVLHRVAKACAEASCEDELIERTTDIIGQIFYPDNFGIMLLDGANEHLRFHPSYKGIPEEFISTEIQLGEGITGRVAQTEELLRVSDVFQEPSYIHLYHQTRSELCVPLKSGEDVIGVVNTEHIEPDAYSEADERLLLTLADQMATAIHRLRSESSSRGQAHQLAAIYQASQDIVTNLELEQVYLATHQAVSQLMPSEAFVITVLDPEKEEIVPLYFVDRHGRSSPPRIPADRGLSGHVIKTGEPVLIDDVEKGIDIDAVQAGDPKIVRSVLAVPMQYRGEVFGMLSAQSYQPGVYTPENQQTLSTLANQVAIAIENARLFEETHRQAAQQEALNGIIAATATARDVSELLETVLDYALNALGLDSGEVWVREHLAMQGLPTQARLSDKKGNGHQPARALAIKDWNTQEGGIGERALARAMKKLGLRASLTVPVLCEGERIGEMTLACQEPRRWLSKEIALLESVGRQLGSAVERLHLLEKTQEQAKQMQQIMDSVPDGVLLIDPRHQVSLTNSVAQRYLAELVNGFGPQGEADNHRPIKQLGDQVIQDILHSNQAWVEVKIHQPAYKIFEVAAQPLQSLEKDEGWVLVLRNVTQERENQNRIQMQERLATVGQLAAGIAHDFNNIMAAIVVYADLLMLEHNFSPANQGRLKIIQRQVKRASSLIRQILDFSRRSVMEQSELDLVPFIKELYKLLGRVLPETIHLELELETGTYLVKADPARLQQALMNLSLNAKDAMPSGGTIRFEMGRFSLQADEPSPVPDLSAGEWIYIKVIDNGEGIPPEVMPHIFEPFFTTKPVGQGTGLGLAQVYGIIKQHGGSIEFESRPGQGATFSIYLPALRATEEEVDPLNPARSARGDGESILLVEDDRAAREAMRDLLLTQNYHVRVAANGAEALTLLSKPDMQISLVITDIVMPEMGGLELYQYLRERQLKTKVLFITGHPLNGRSKTLLEAGEVQWLQKPFSVRQFNDLVHALLNGRD